MTVPMLAMTAIAVLRPAITGGTKRKRAVAGAGARAGAGAATGAGAAAGAGAGDALEPEPGLHQLRQAVVNAHAHNVATMTKHVKGGAQQTR